MLFSCGDSLKKTYFGSLSWGFCRLDGVDDIADGVGVTLLNTAGALRGAFFLSTNVELKTKGAGGGGAGRGIADFHVDS